jgi:hypothetical protein
MEIITMAKFSTIDVIKVSAYETSMNGYTKRSEDARVVCTADAVFDALIDHSVDESELEKMNDRIVAWNNYLKDPNQENDYILSVRSEIVKPMIDESKIGLIASSFASFDRYIKFKMLNEKDKQSDFLGEEGDSVTFEISEYKLVKTGSSKYNKGSKWYLYHIKDVIGNIIIFFADHNCDDEFRNHSKATATISKLTTYNEVKQTNVSKLIFI